MVSKLPEFLFNLVTLIGIALAVGGSVGVLKYEKRPRKEDSDKWIKNYEKTHGKWDPKLTDLLRGELDVGSVWDANDIESPKKFIESWKTRRKISRILIFIGPVIAAIPIALSILDV